MDKQIKKQDLVSNVEHERIALVGMGAGAFVHQLSLVIRSSFLE